MKRYDLGFVARGSTGYNDLIEGEHGDWVEYEDVVKLEAERNEARKLIRDFCVAVAANNTPAIIAATFFMNQSQREWK